MAVPGYASASQGRVASQAALDPAAIESKLDDLIADQQARVERHARRAEKQAARRGERCHSADFRWEAAIARLDDLIQVQAYLRQLEACDGDQRVRGWG